VNVARLVNRLPPARGGKELHVAELCGALADLGVHQRVFARVGDAPDPRVSLTRMDDRFSRDARRTLVAFGPWAAAQALQAHRKERFDLVHVHGDFVEAGAGAAAARACGIPAVLTVHGDFRPVRRHDFLRRATFSRMRTIWAVSDGVADSIRRLGVSVPIVVRPSGVRRHFFAVDDGARTLGIVAVGRLSPVKGLAHLIAAYDLVGEQLGLPWNVFAGGSGRYAEQVRSEIARRPGMRCIEERDPARVADHLAQASVFVLPSVEEGDIREGVPTALLEAIASRTPVVATDTGGARRVLDGGKAGLLVPPADPVALSHAIVAAIEDPVGARSRAEHAIAAGYAVPWREVATTVAARYASLVEERSI
jgi:glycosyltransferase involved in cell wall biosynthesis